MSSGDQISILLNGDPMQRPAGESLAELIRALDLREELVAIEVNRELLRRASFAERRIEPGDQIEIVEFVGGG